MKVKLITLLLYMVFGLQLAGCVVGRWVMDGVEAYQRGQEAARLTNEEIAATEHAKALTAIPLTQRAQTATVAPSSTLSPDETPIATEIPPPPPTPVPIMWVKPKPGAWFRFYNNPGLVDGSGSGTQQGGYYPGSSIWDDDSPDPITESGITSLGVVGSYDHNNAPVLPVINTASGDAFRQVILEAYIEISDFNRAINLTAGIEHNWGHSPNDHAHLWPEPNSSDRQKVIGFLEPGLPVDGEIPWLKLKILEVTPDARMAKVRITGIWMDSDDTVVVESP